MEPRKKPQPEPFQPAVEKYHTPSSLTRQSIRTAQHLVCASQSDCRSPIQPVHTRPHRSGGSLPCLPPQECEGAELPQLRGITSVSLPPSPNSPHPTTRDWGFPRSRETGALTAQIVLARPRYLSLLLLVVRLEERLIFVPASDVPGRRAINIPLARLGLGARQLIPVCFVSTDVPTLLPKVPHIPPRVGSLPRAVHSASDSAL
ncbi:hypothetical protein B0T24DRAFT_33549 [Lasiosphaeria ovina]|uniref:Uncharacterized protein n=1 Tax=Lasiosphaeria ovina TaxID=92902 RepID=A0AAE0TXH4_9PEZI|nr:hypothetical protein B0T24DRAFT_33549 [Lasiosphaeria ovina]